MNQVKDKAYYEIEMLQMISLKQIRIAEIEDGDNDESQSTKFCDLKFCIDMIDVCVEGYKLRINELD